jgi:hypothetical protein
VLPYCELFSPRVRSSGVGENLLGELKLQTCASPTLNSVMILLERPSFRCGPSPKKLLNTDARLALTVAHPRVHCCQIPDCGLHGSSRSQIPDDRSSCARNVVWFQCPYHPYYQLGDIELLSMPRAVVRSVDQVTLLPPAVDWTAPPLLLCCLGSRLTTIFCALLAMW